MTARSPERDRVRKRGAVPTHKRCLPALKAGCRDTCTDTTTADCSWPGNCVIHMMSFSAYASLIIRCIDIPAPAGIHSTLRRMCDPPRSPVCRTKLITRFCPFRGRVSVDENSGVMSTFCPTCVIAALRMNAIRFTTKNRLFSFLPRNPANNEHYRASCGLESLLYPNISLSTLSLVK